MRKLIRDGKVAVILSKGSGNWYKSVKPEWRYLPELVELIESEDYKHSEEDFRIKLVSDCLLGLGYHLTASDLEWCFNEEGEYVESNFYRDDSISGYYIGAANNLRVEWIELNKPFRVEEGEAGGDFIEFRDEIAWEILTE